MDKPDEGEPACLRLAPGGREICKDLLSSKGHIVGRLCSHVQREDGFCPLRPRIGPTPERVTGLSKEATDSFDRFSKHCEIARRAQGLLRDLFARFDPKDIYPRHGPGVVSSRERLWNKYLFRNVSGSITEHYPLDEFFFSSLGHVCDEYDRFKAITDRTLPAKVLLVPKDSRGPRLISCEPVDFQWIQQGLSIAIRQNVETHPLTKWNVHFTNQQSNQFGALLGSSTGRYATLDLNEASDRVSVALVDLLFPERIKPFLFACRSLETELPDGRILKLRKFAPMGSALCFPILALTIWAILTAAAPDHDTRESILVYGDDVIVPTAFAGDAIELLESFGLKINRDKSCIKGFFRESCGVDAFQGTNVTPVRFRTVWSSLPSPDVYTSWIAYANHLWCKRYFETYNKIVGALEAVYGPIPTKDMVGKSCPSLIGVAERASEIRRRTNRDYQCLEFRCTTVTVPTITYEVNGWVSLLRFFAEAGNGRNRKTSPSMACEGQDDELLYRDGFSSSYDGIEPFSVRVYTRRGTSKLVRRWVTPILGGDDRDTPSWLEHQQAGSR